MKTNIKNLLRIACGLSLGLVLTAAVAEAQPQSTSKNASAKTSEIKKSGDVTETRKATTPNEETVPTSQTVGDDAGDFTVTSSIEFGYRGQRVRGDVNKFKSDLNYKAGPRLFDTTFLMKSKDGGKGDLFETFLITTTGWGADPSGNMRISVEKPELYRFEGIYRRFKYYRYLNNVVNPTWFFSQGTVFANPVTGLHTYDVKTQMGDFDLTILPKNETIRFNVGYSPERYDGLTFTNYHAFGNEFWLPANLRSRADDYRLGADGKLGPIDWTFLQGFRRFRDDSTIDEGFGINPSTATSVAQLTSFNRQEPNRGRVNFTRFSLHSLVANKLDITGRIIYSKTTSNYLYVDNFSGRNINPRFTGWPPTGGGSATPNTTNPSFYSTVGNIERPNTVGDIGITYLVTNKFRLSNTFRVEDFTIDGLGTANNFLSISRPGRAIEILTVSDRSELTTVKYRKYQNTFEGDYEFTKNYSVHFGYRYGKRHEEQSKSGFDIRSSGAPPIAATFEEETNHTNAVFGGFKIRPTTNWTVYLDAERGTADNVFTRIGNYDYTNIRAKTRIAPNRKVNLNFGLIVRNNSNPSEIAGVSLADFGVDLKTRVFTSSIDWMPNSNITINTGYNFNWVNSDAVVEYTFGVPPATNVRHLGHALYYQRLHNFYLDLTTRLNRRMTLFSSYRINRDNGQGNRVADPAGGTLLTPAVGSTLAFFNGGTLITSYPMNFQSPEARLAIRINRHVDWNLGYQYFGYNESDFLKTFPGSPRAQNYHAHLPYMSLRLYFGRKE